MDRVNIELLRPCRALDRFEIHQNILVPTERHGSPALIVHQRQSVIGRRELWVEVRRLSIEEGVAVWEGRYGDVGPLFGAVWTGRERAVGHVAVEALPLPVWACAE